MRVLTAPGVLDTWDAPAAALRALSFLSQGIVGLLSCVAAHFSVGACQPTVRVAAALVGLRASLCTVYFCYVVLWLGLCMCGQHPAMRVSPVYLL
jgi:hypothetical protein